MPPGSTSFFILNYTREQFHFFIIIINTFVTPDKRDTQHPLTNQSSAESGEQKMEDFMPTVLKTLACPKGLFCALNMQTKLCFVLPLMVKFNLFVQR